MFRAESSERLLRERRIVPARLISLLFFLVPGLASRALPQDTVHETEPNNTPATADTVALGGRFAGIKDSAEDVDYWVIPNVRAGDTIYVDVDASEFHSSLVPGARLLAGDGVTMIQAEDNGDGLDPYLVYVAPTSGSYYIAISGSLTGGWGPSAFYTVNLKPSHCPIASQEHEPNDTIATAQALSFDQPVTALSCPARDRDFYRLNVDRGRTTYLEVRVPGMWRPTFGEADNIAYRMSIVDARDSTLMVRWQEVGANGDSTRLTWIPATAGPYYAEVDMYPGGFRYSYQVKLAHGPEPGPGDSVLTLADSLGSPYDIATSATGDLYIPEMEHQRILRFSNGSMHEFAKGLFITDVAFDAFGNLLAAGLKTGWCCRAGDGVVYRVLPNGSYQALIGDLVEPFGLAGAPDGSIWVGDMAQRLLRHYDPSGHLLSSYDVSGLQGWAPTEVGFAPSGELYMSTEEALYRVTNGAFQLILQESRIIRGFAFDSLGNVYVANMGELRDDGFGGEGRIDYFDRNGTPLITPFALTPDQPQRIAFGRDADGKPNRHLYFTDGTRIGEVKRGSVSAPGGEPPRGGPACAVVDREPNDNAQTAESLAVGTARSGALCPANDADYYAVTADSGVLVVLSGDGAAGASLELLGADGATHLASDSGRTHYHASVFIRSSSKKYVVVHGVAASTGAYTLLAQPAIDPSRAAQDLFVPTLSAAERATLDDLGNQNGHYDLGDLRILMRREGVAR
jgi:hypothetical protein